MAQTTDYSTHTKIMTVFACGGNFCHVMNGFTILKAAKGYVCPYCGADVKDVTDTLVGKAFFAQSRPDLFPPPPSPTGSRDNRKFVL